MKTSLILTATVLATAFAGIAHAQAAPRTETAAASPGPHCGGRGVHAPARLRAADANGDGRVGRAEVEALRVEEFAFRDRNSDGFLDLEDASPTRRRIAEMHAENGVAGDGRGGRRGDRMARLDSDEDGRISRAEFLAAPNPLFDRLDSDDDGVVTAEEIQAGMAEARERRSERRGRGWRRRD